MVWLLRKCEKCGKYTLKKDKCPYCSGKVRAPHPPKFSPDDKYLKYRMALKMERLNE
ncbi:MAG: RNA-protein complex protein Nop10 [Candidatus Bathyarchaeales archaeon]